MTEETMEDARQDGPAGRPVADANRTYYILADAVAEIESLRTAVAHLRPKADAYDRLCQLLDLARPIRDGEGASWRVDPIHSLREYMEEIHAGIIAEKQVREEIREPKTDDPDHLREYLVRAAKDRQMAQKQQEKNLRRHATGETAWPDPKPLYGENLDD